MMKTLTTFLFLSLFITIASNAQSDLERYKKEQNEALENYKKDYKQALNKLDAAFSEYIAEEDERMKVYLTTGSISTKNTEKVSNLEKMYPKLSMPITIEESQATLNLSLTNWQSNIKKVSTKDEAIKKELEINEALLNVEDEEKNLVQDIVPSVEIVETAKNMEVSEELSLEIEANRPVMCPLPKRSYRISSEFSHSRLHPILHVHKKHEGIDLAASKGTRVYAAANGVVSLCKYSKSAGKYIIIDHENGYTTSYMHLRTMKVKNGQRVKRGQLIGEVGNTGYSTGPHLHYEVRKDGNAYDPAPFLLKHFN